MQNYRPCPTCAGSGIAPASATGNVPGQLDIFDAPGRLQANPHTTSARAAGKDRPIPRFGTQRHEALLALDQHGAQTAAEVAGRIGVSRNQTATRLGELREGGLIAYCRDIETGAIATRATGPDDEGNLQIITAKGREALIRIRPPKGNR